jgi:hypothetical protein
MLPKKPFSNKRSKTKAHPEGIQSMADLLTKLAILDEETARYVEKGLAKVLRYVAATGSRVAIRDGSTRLVTFECIERPSSVRLRAVVDPLLQKSVKVSQKPASPVPPDPTAPSI